MKLFYDFETSSKDFLGQILSYSFILVDDNYQVQTELNGLIKPNRLELPSYGAILTNKLSVKTLMLDGDTEFNAAQRIYTFINHLTNEHGHIPLIGFNSSNFDFKHYEKLLLKFGLSPTFYGKISSCDVLQFAKYCALKKPSHFPFVKTVRDNINTFSFKLEDLSNVFNCLDVPQTHDAKDDVLLTIELTKALESSIGISLNRFRDEQMNTMPFSMPSTTLIEPFFAYEQNNKSPIIDHRHWITIGKASKTTFILLDIDGYKNHIPESFEDYASLTRYLNLRSKALICSNQPIDKDLETKIKTDTHIQTIADQALQYFKLFPVGWDIEYRPWAMGFDLIDELNNYINRLYQDMSQYDVIIAELLQMRNEQLTRKDNINFMITLFNRFYLNYHPSPNPDYIYRYIKPRYITGTMFRNSEDFMSLESEKIAIESHLSTVNPTSHDHMILTELKELLTSFCHHVQFG